MAGKTMQLRKAAAWPVESSADVQPDPPEADAPKVHDSIAELAYFKAEQRGFEPGHELEDWLAAETELAG